MDFCIFTYIYFIFLINLYITKDTNNKEISLGCKTEIISQDFTVFINTLFEGNNSVYFNDSIHLYKSIFGVDIVLDSIPEQ